jgi:uncharacterized protein YhaN
MKIKNIIAMTLVIAGVAAAGLTGARQVSAQEETTNLPPLIQNLAERFGLNTGEVEQVMEEVRTEKQQQVRSHREERLQEAVDEGVITAEQKQALLDKQAEWEAQREQQREEMRQWMDESGIDFEALREYGCGLAAGPGGFGGGFKAGPHGGGW